MARVRYGVNRDQTTRLSPRVKITWPRLQSVKLLEYFHRTAPLLITGSESIIEIYPDNTIERPASSINSALVNSDVHLKRVKGAYYHAIINKAIVRFSHDFEVQPDPPFVQALPTYVTSCLGN
jgi:hypothetical protein